ncbi:hypothetical protein VMCG_10018 [Cytospora schulzeri]|uniref:Uncharacterized protein n=1 Tax=Cytospora schulzeri TaxID=448051 RepID=A0A423VI63_9PEZI|nr:hypothetical protein VMCG_10018 [Valsa malicola]
MAPYSCSRNGDDHYVAGVKLLFWRRPIQPFSSNGPTYNGVKPDAPTAGDIESSDSTPDLWIPHLVG